MDKEMKILLSPWAKQIDETKRHNPCGVPLLLKEIAQEVEAHYGDKNTINALLKYRDEEIDAIFWGCD
jgi:hypothetical protein